LCRLVKRSFAHRLAIGTRRGILLLWDEDHVNISNIHIGTHLISASVMLRACGTSFKIKTAYDPSTDIEKRNFLDEAIAEAPINDESKWLTFGDFNLIYQVADKNNNNINLMGQLRDVLNTCPLIFIVWPLPAAPLKPVQDSQACHFRFENFWTKMPGFLYVRSTWEELSSHTHHVHILNHKMKTTAKNLRA
jgi:hypothetical protein